MSGMEKAAALLKSGSTSQRKKAVKYLTLSNRETALKLLAWAAKNDNDPEIKEYARKGYRHLKNAIESGASPSTTTSTGAASLLAYQQRKTQEQPTVQQDAEDAYDAYEDDYAVDRYDDTDDDGYYDEGYDDGGGYADDDSLFAFDDGDDDYEAESSSRREGPIDMRARKEIRSAMESHIDGDDERALASLINAIRIDDRSTQDNEAMNVAAAVTGMEGSSAMRAIQDKDFQRSFLKGGKSKGDANDPTWGTAWVDILIFTLILGVGLVSTLLVTAARFTPLLTQLGTDPQFASFFTEADITQADFLELVQLLNSSVVILIVMAVIYTLATVLSSFIQFFVIHFAAITFFNGSKPSAVTMDKLFNFSSIITGISFTMILVVLFLMPTNMSAYTGGAGGTAVGGIVIAFSIGMVILSVVSGIGQIVVVSRAQEIGFISGCLSIFVGGIILSVAQCTLSFGFSFLTTFITALGAAGG